MEQLFLNLKKSF